MKGRRHGNKDLALSFQMGEQSPWCGDVALHLALRAAVSCGVVSGGGVKTFP